MERVYKYTIDPSKTFIEMPLYAEIISAAFQAESLVVWARINTSETKTELRRIIAFSTGQDIGGDNLGFISTVFLDDLVFHVFEDFQ